MSGRIERAERYGVRINGTVWAVHESRERIEWIAADLRQRMRSSVITEFTMQEIRPGERVVAVGEEAVERVAMAMEESESLGAMQARDLARVAITALLTPPHGSDT